MTTRVRAEMPGDAPRRKPARPRGWVIGAAGVLIALGYAAYQMIVGSAVPNGYKGRNWDLAVDGPWPYPTDDVRSFLIVMALDALFGIWLLQRRSTTTLPVRSLAFGLINGLAIVAMAPMMMHAGQPITGLLGGFLWATLWGLMFALCAAIARLTSLGPSTPDTSNPP